MTKEINIFSYIFTPVREKVSFYSNNKGKYTRSRTIVKSPNPIIELF